MTFSEFERVLNHCPHLTNFWLFLRVGEFLLFVLLTSMKNFIRAIKTECLDKIIFTDEYQLRFAVKEYLEYWNHYRPHAGLNGNMVLPYPQNASDEIQEIPFLGGLLHGYRRIRPAA